MNVQCTFIIILDHPSKFYVSFISKMKKMFSIRQVVGGRTNMHGHDSCSELQLTLFLSLTLENSPFLCKGVHRIQVQHENQSHSLPQFPQSSNPLGTPSNHFTRQLRERHCWSSEQEGGSPVSCFRPHCALHCVTGHK